MYKTKKFVVALFLAGAAFCALTSGCAGKGSADAAGAPPGVKINGINGVSINPAAGFTARDARKAREDAKEGG